MRGNRLLLSNVFSCDTQKKKKKKSCVTRDFLPSQAHCVIGKLRTEWTEHGDWCLAIRSSNSVFVTCSLCDLSKFRSLSLSLFICQMGKEPRSCEEILGWCSVSATWTASDTKRQHPKMWALLFSIIWVPFHPRREKLKELQRHIR